MILTLGGYGLNTPETGLAISETDLESLAEVQDYPLDYALNDGVDIPYHKYKAREINLRGWLQEDSIDAFEKRLNIIKRITANGFIRLAKNYDPVLPNFEPRSWTVLVTQWPFDRKHLPDSAKFMLRAIAPSPFAEGDNSFGGNATLNTPEDIVFRNRNQVEGFALNIDQGVGAGTVDRNQYDVTTLIKPIIDLTISSDFNTETLIISNPSLPSQTMTITTTGRYAMTKPVVGDKLQIDCLRKTVILNRASSPFNEKVHYSGRIPVWSPSEDKSTLRITTQNLVVAQLRLSYKNRYL